MIENTEGKDSTEPQQAPGITFSFREPISACFVHADGRVFVPDQIGKQRAMVDLVKRARSPKFKQGISILPMDPKPDGVLFEFRFPVAFCFIHNDGRIFVPDTVHGARVMIDLVKRIRDVDGQRRLDLAKKGILAP